MELSLLAIWSLGVGVVWSLFNLSVAWAQRYVPSLERALEGTPELDEAPSVTVVVPARNERDRIAESVRRILGQRGVDLNLVVVDDRSDDGTGEILERLAAGESRLRVVRVETLPEEWLGKQHACHVGARDARGEWILFTDADTWMNEGLIADTVRAAVAERADLVCLLPAQKRISLWGRAAMLNFSMALILAAARANRDRKHAPVGIGAFNLVRADAYRRAGGYEALRMEVIDDMKLGVLLLRFGARLRCWTAANEAEMDWAATPGELMRALEKNFFALAYLNFWIAGFSVSIIGAAWLTAILGPFSGHWSGYVAFAGLASTVVPAALFARRSGWGLLSGVLAVVVFPLLPLSLVRSTWTAWRQGGIRWRGTFYSLEQLRRHRVPLFVRPPRH